MADTGDDMIIEKGDLVRFFLVGVMAAALLVALVIMIRGPKEKPEQKSVFIRLGGP